TISWPRARRTVSRASTTTIAATLTASHAARSNCSNAKVTAWFSNRLPKREPPLTGDFLSSVDLFFDRTRSVHGTNSQAAYVRVERREARPLDCAVMRVV